MSRQVLTPGQYMPVEGPMIFLAGPMDGAVDWQQAAVDQLGELAPTVHVANPRRELGPGDELSTEQIDWETGFLRRAGNHGVILFWLAAEQQRVPWRAYAQTARAELFEWKARHELAGARLVLGIEEGFGGASYIRRRFEQEARDVPIFAGFDESCVAAAQMARAATPSATR